MDNRESIRPGIYVGSRSGYELHVKPNGWGVWVNRDTRGQLPEITPDQVRQAIEEEDLRWAEE